MSEADDFAQIAANFSNSRLPDLAHRHPLRQLTKRRLKLNSAPGKDQHPRIREKSTLSMILPKRKILPMT
jgi:hypothetical protein